MQYHPSLRTVSNPGVKIANAFVSRSACPVVQMQHAWLERCDSSEGRHWASSERRTPCPRKEEAKHTKVAQGPQESIRRPAICRNECARLLDGEYAH